MDRVLDVRLTVDALRDARALIAAQGDPDRGPLTEQLLSERLAGLTDDQIIAYLVGTLFATVVTGWELVKSVAELNEAWTCSEVVHTLDVIEAHA